MNPKRILAYFKVFARTYIRNRVGLFFSLIFPIILILLFGAIFSNSGSTTVALYVQNLDHASPASMGFLAALNRTQVFSVTMVSPSVADFSGWMSANGGGGAGLQIPPGFQADFASNQSVNVLVFTDPAQASVAGIAEGTISNVATAYNCHGCAQLVGVTQVPVGSTTFTYIDYLVPGLIGFSILVSPMFAMVNVSSEYKKQKIFRQLSLTPLTRGEWLFSSILWFVLLVLASTAIMLGVGRGLFNADVSPNLLTLPILVLGPVMFVSLGLLLGSVSKTPESAAVAGNVLTFPMMFLSGTFFPVSQFPAYLQTVAHFLPLYYVIDGMNETMLFHQTGPALVDIAVVAALAVIFFVAAVWAFRWQEQ